MLEGEGPNSLVKYVQEFNTTSWSLLGPGVEVGLTPNCMKGIHIFSLLIVGSFYFIFLQNKLDVQCMVIAKKEQNKILFQNSFESMFNKYNKQCKVGEGNLNSYFYKKSKFYKVCNDSKSNVCFNIMVGFWKLKHQNPINIHWNLDCLLLILLIRCGYISY